MTSVGLRIGNLEATPVLERPDLVAEPVFDTLRAHPDLAVGVGVAEIDPACADTENFCAAYGVDPAVSANCVIVAGKRQGELRFAACVVLATTRTDVNTVVRRQLDVRKVSFAPIDEAVRLAGMEYGGITPIGLPRTWPVLVDAAVAQAGRVVIGSGLRRSKLTVPTDLFSNLTEVVVLPGLGQARRASDTQILNQ